MFLRLKVELGNSAMHTPSDVAYAVQKALQREGHEGAALGIFEPLELGDSGIVRDGNGNTVGRWEVGA